MRYLFVLFALVFGALTVTPPAQADGKAAIKPPVVLEPAPLQQGRLQGGPEQAPEPVRPRIISRTISAPDEGLRLNDAFVLSLNGGVGTGVADVGFGGGGGFFGSRAGGGDFGRSQRFRAARQFQRRGGSSRRGGRRGFGGRR